MSAPYYADESVTLYHGDCLDVLRALPDASVDAVVTDPPYGLADHTPAIVAKALGAWLGGDREHVPDGRGFMGRDWDRFVPPPAVFDECFRVLKPGGFLLTFAGSRTVDLMTTSVRFAGFEIRDSIAWLYGSGFPKSRDVSKAIDKGAGVDREVLGLSPYSSNRHAGSYQADDTTHGYIGRAEGARLITAAATEAAQQWQGWGTALKPAFEPIVVGRKPLTGTVAANVLEHGTGALNIDGCRIPAGQDYADKCASVVGLESSAHGAGRWPTNVVLDESQAAELDKQTGVLTSGKMKAGTKPIGTRNTYGQDAAKGYETAKDTPGDSGGASRFFPTFRYEAKAPTSERPRDGEVAHPTVKPLDLMRWLVRLVTPPGGTVLEPFAGSGTTAEACVIEGFQCIAIEREADYLPLIVNRLSKPIQMGLDFEAGGAA